MIMQTKVELSGVNTTSLKVLRNDETLELIRKARQGDKKARDGAICLVSRDMATRKKTRRKRRKQHPCRSAMRR